MPSTSLPESTQSKPARAGQRIAFVSSSLGFGGATTFVLNLCRGLQQLGVRVMVLSLEREHAFRSDFEEAGIPTFIQDETREIYEDRLANVLTALANFHPTAVVANLGYSSYEVLRYVPEHVRRACIVHADHAMFYDVAVMYAKHLDVVVGVSEEIRDTLSKISDLAHADARFLTSGVPVPATLEHEANPADRPIRIIYMGRLERPQKRVHLFPEILKGLVESGIPFHWTIVGEGSERQFLTEHLAADGPNQAVTILQSIPNREVNALLRKQDILLLASDCEGLPISLLEAMAAGVVPVVTKLESGIADLVGTTCGVQVHSDNIVGYSEAIVQLYRNKQTLRGYSAACHQRVLQDYSCEAMSAKWLGILHNQTEAAPWPSSWNIRVPYFANNGLYYSQPARIIRRLMKHRPIDKQGKQQPSTPG